MPRTRPERQVAPPWSAKDGQGYATGARGHPKGDPGSADDAPRERRGGDGAPPDAPGDIPRASFRKI